MRKVLPPPDTANQSCSDPHYHAVIQTLQASKRESSQTQHIYHFRTELLSPPRSKGVKSAYQRWRHSLPHQACLLTCARDVTRARLIKRLDARPSCSSLRSICSFRKLPPESVVNSRPDPLRPFLAHYAFRAGEGCPLTAGKGFKPKWLLKQVSWRGGVPHAAWKPT